MCRCNTDLQINCFTFSHLYVVVQLVWIAAFLVSTKFEHFLELLTYIEAHYNEDIGLNELADMVKMNTAYLSVLFKSEVGMSYVKFLTSLRIDKAKNLLKKGYKVYEVSEMVGYNNYRYFTDIFKKYTGETPKNYQNHVYHQDAE